MVTIDRSAVFRYRRDAERKKGMHNHEETPTFPPASDIQKRFLRLQSSPWLVYAATRGVAGTLMGRLRNAAGDSDIILGMRYIPDAREFETFVGGSPDVKDSYSRAAAVALAAASYANGRALAIMRDCPANPVVGIGMTADLRSKRGADENEHLVFVAAKTEKNVRVARLVFNAGLSREQEAEVCDFLMLSALLEATGYGGYSISRDDLGNSPKWVKEASDGLQMDIHPLHNGDAVQEYDRFGGLLTIDPKRHLLFPGNFDPLHPAHENCAEIASLITGKEVVYQLTTRQPLAAAITYDEMMRRAMQFLYHKPFIILEKEALYIQKARKYPGVHMLLGARALRHLLQPEHYHGGIAGLESTLDEFRLLDTRFAVMGQVVDGAFKTVHDFKIPAKHRGLFYPIPGRNDISALNLRLLTRFNH